MLLFLSLSPSLCQTDTFFSVMRLVIPQVDKSRAAYGLKETALAKQYIDILNIAKDSRDAKKLLNYRAPTAAQQVKGDSVWGNVTCFEVSMTEFHTGFSVWGGGGDVMCGLTGMGEYFSQVTPRNGAKSIVVSFC